MKANKAILLLALAAHGLLVRPSAAQACASCGSGGDDPMILYPNEKQKFYFGLGRTSGFRNVDGDGTVSTAGGPTVKETATFSYGYGFSPRSFATLTIPFARNELEGDSRTSMGDPSVATRYTVVMQSIAEPWLPQVQAVAGYKQSQATSIHDSEELKTQIDVFGTGFSEAKAGVDVWYGQSDLKVGFAHAFVFPQERSFDGLKYQPGLGQRSTASVGYGFAHAKATIGANQEVRRRMRVDGEEQVDSDQLNHSAFLTLEVMPSPLDTIRISGGRQAAFGANKSTARSNALTAAYMKAL